MLKGILILIAYFVVAVILALCLKRFTKIPNEPMRKVLHLIITMAVHVYVFAFDYWYQAMIALVGFVVLVYPIVILVEKIPFVMSVLNERKKGEIRNSLFLVHIMIALLIGVFWGIMGEEWKYIVVAAIMAWGFGDAAAALVGKRYGKHKIKGKYLDGKKSYEGSLAMAITAAIVTFPTLLIYSGEPWQLCFVATCFCAPMASFVELISNEGNDTLSVPIASAIPIVFIMFFFSTKGIA